MDNGAEAYVIGRTIVLNDRLYIPRMNFRFCHELAHLILGHQSRKTVSYEDEKEADRLAGELLLPREEFHRLMRRNDLAQLKNRYPYASWEAIARKWSELRPAVLTIYDDRRLVYRHAPEGFNFPPQPTPPEWKIVDLCYAEARHHSEIANELLIQGFFVDDNEIKRVLLLTEVLE